MRAGFKRVRPLAGGIEAWVEQGYAVELLPKVEQRTRSAGRTSMPRAAGTCKIARVVERLACVPARSKAVYWSA